MFIYPYDSLGCIKDLKDIVPHWTREEVPNIISIMNSS